MAKPFYTKATDMQVLIDRYFDECREEGRPLTVTGLALALGFTSRQALINYGDGTRPGKATVAIKAEFIDTVKKAKARIEMDCEERLVSGKNNPAGLIFSLKNNYGWRDKQEIDVQGGWQVELSWPGKDEGEG